MCGDRGDVEGTWWGCECGEMGSWTGEGGGDSCFWFGGSLSASVEGDKWNGNSFY